VNNFQKLKTNGGIEVERYEFESFAEVEKFFLDHMDEYSAEGYSTKVIGLTLLIFKKEGK